MLDSMLATLGEALASLVSTVQTVFGALEADVRTFVVDELPKILVALAILVVANYLGQRAARLAEGALRRSKADAQVTRLLATLTRWAVLGAGAVVALGLFTDVSSLVTTLGLVGFAVTFAFQDVLKNLVSGIIIMVQHPFKVGDSVSLDGFDGTVVAISSRSTEIACFDGRLVLIPNGNTIGNAIINFTRSPQRRIDLPLRLNYASDVESLRSTIVTALEGVPGYLAEPAPRVVFDALGELSLGLTVYFWVDMSLLDSTLTARDRGMVLIARALSEKGVPMPVPVQSLGAQVNRQ
jgi:small conductance mechanosensitive channel